MNERRTLLAASLLAGFILVAGAAAGCSTPERVAEGDLSTRTSSADQPAATAAADQTEAMSAEDVQPAPTATHVAAAPTPQVQFVENGLAWSGVGNETENATYLDLEIKVVEDSDVSKEQAKSELLRVSEQLSTTCVYHNMASLHPGGETFRLYHFGDVSEECFSLVRGKIPVYEGVPEEAWELARDLGPSPYGNINPLTFRVLTAGGYLTAWRYNELPLDIASTAELEEMDCFEESLRQIGWEGEEYVVLSGVQTGPLSDRYGLLVPSDAPEMPQICSLSYLYEVPEPPAAVNLSAEGSKMTVSHQDDAGNRIEFELRPGTGVHNVVHHHEYGSTWFEFDPWTLIYLDGAQIFLTLDEQGEIHWLATQSWEVAEQVAEMVAYPNLEGKHGPNLMIHAVGDEPDKYRIKEGDEYHEHTQGAKLLQ